ncbi:hypothetical protein BLIN101_01314 [Brevibacterium linens]|uniref:Uncharacterized protein n=2 Tax=Brevibacterium linens TaxID=1703 RepID=A0A2H1IKY1_BRELN|nr:hypothetical protein BLIN101_01314 [Brevibacterium linens]
MVACMSRGCSTDEIMHAVGLDDVALTPRLSASAVRAKEPFGVYETWVDGQHVRTKTRYDTIHPVTHEKLGKDFSVEWELDDDERVDVWPAVYPHDDAVTEVHEVAQDHDGVTVVICEGEKDADAVAALYSRKQVPAVAVSIPDGTSNVETNAEAVLRLDSALQPEDDDSPIRVEYIIAVDRDSPGVRGAAALYVQLRKEELNVRLGAAAGGHHDAGDAAEAGFAPPVEAVESLAGLLIDTGLPADPATHRADGLAAQHRCAEDLGLNSVSDLRNHLLEAMLWALHDQGRELVQMARSKRKMLRPLAATGVWHVIRSVKATAAATFREVFDLQLSAGDAGTAATQIDGWLDQQTPVDPPTRFNRDNSGVIEVDLGPDAPRQTVRIDPTQDTLSFITVPTVPFFREAQTVPLPDIDRDATVEDVDLLWEVVNARHEQRHWILAWLVLVISCARENSPLVFRGIAGSGKSTAQRILLDLVDPRSRDPRTQLAALPNDQDGFALLAEKHTAFGVDNVSHIPTALQETFQMAVTGGVATKRKLYTDGDVVEHDLSVNFLLSSLTITGLKTDAVDRMTTIDIDRPDHRPSSTEITTRWRKMAPTVFTALLRLTQAVMQERTRREDELRDLRTHRIREFGETVWLLDQLRGGDGHDALMDNRQHAQAEARLDPYLRALCTHLAENPELAEKTYTISQLLRLDPHRQVYPLTIDEERALDQAVPESERRFGKILREQIDILHANGFAFKEQGDRRKGSRWSIAIPDGDTPAERLADVHFTPYPYGRAGEREQRRERRF